MTFQRNELYRDPVLLWSDTVEKSPQKARPHNNLGHAYVLRDDWDRAIEEFRIAASWIPTTRSPRKIFATPISTRWGDSKQLRYSFPTRNTACPYRSRLRGLFPAIPDIQSHEQQLMAVLKHAGDQTTPGFARVPGFHACHVRIEEQLVGATEKDLPGAVHAGDVPRDRSDHHGNGRHLQRLLCQLG